MTEIDNLARITLRDLRPFFGYCQKIREEVGRHTEGKSMDERLDFAERNHHKIAHLLRWDYIFTSSSYYSETKMVLDVEAIIDPLDIEVVGFIFRWERDGKKMEERIGIERRRSNLGLNPVRYLVCPYTKRRCRKLFTDWQAFASRWAFPHTYSQRNYSHRWRREKKLLDVIDFLESDKSKNRKERYRGRLTPFGRKIKRMVGGENLEEIRAQLHQEIEFFLLPSRRGRPPK